MHRKNIVTGGRPVDEADKVLILIHGRGASAQDILTIAPYMNVAEYALLAPQATNSTWYPYSFMVAAQQNQPWLDSALELLKELVRDINEQGIPAEYIYLLGFSQGACLTLEFAARNATRYGGLAAFTGGLIGDMIDPLNYSGDFNRTPVFISTGDPDPHVPLERVNDSAAILREMNADVTLKVYNGKSHSISQEELELANQLVFKA